MILCIYLDSTPNVSFLFVTSLRLTFTVQNCVSEEFYTRRLLSSSSIKSEYKTGTYKLILCITNALEADYGPVCNLIRCNVDNGSFKHKYTVVYLYKLHILSYIFSDLGFFIFCSAS